MSIVQQTMQSGGWGGKLHNPINSQDLIRQSSAPNLKFGLCRSRAVSLFLLTPRKLLF